MGKGAAAAQIGGALGTVVPGLGVATSLFQTIQGAKEQRAAKEALDNYERQQLTNITDGMQVSTLGSDLRREENARATATGMDALRAGGQRTLIGGVGAITANNDKMNAEVAADLDMQQKQIDQMRAEDNARIRKIQEDREIADLSALSSQYTAGKNDMMNGIGAGLTSLGALGTSLANIPRRQETNTIAPLTPIGNVPMSTTGGIVTRPIFNN